MQRLIAAIVPLFVGFAPAESFESRLSQATLAVPGRLMVDTPPESSPMSTATLDRLGSAWGRSVVPVPGGHALVRLSASDRARKINLALQNWLGGLTAAQAGALLGKGNGMDAATIPEDVRAALAAQNPGAVAADFSSGIGTTTIQPYVLVTVVKADGTKVEGKFERKPASDPPGPVSGLPVAPETPPKPVEALAEATQLGTGPLDFSKGRLLTVREIAEMARSKFGKTWAVDSRVAEATLFVRGAWDAPSFTEAFRLVTAVPPSEPMPLESLLSTLTGGPLGDFRSGVYSRGAIEGIAPDAAKWLDKHGVPAGARMECRPALQFHLYGDARPDGNGNFTRDASVFLVR